MKSQIDLTVWLEGDFVSIENPSEEQLLELMRFPEKFCSPLTEDIFLDTSPGYEIDLYFDHKGKVHAAYFSSAAGFPLLKDLNSPSEERIPLSGKNEGGFTREKNMVPIEIANPYILEFGRSIKIDTTTEDWEPTREPFRNSKACFMLSHKGSSVRFTRMEKVK